MMKDDSTSARRTLTIPEVAAILGVSRNSAYEAAARGELPIIKIGKRLLVSRAAFERMVAGETA